MIAFSLYGLIIHCTLTNCQVAYTLNIPYLFFHKLEIDGLFPILHYSSILLPFQYTLFGIIYIRIMHTPFVEEE